MFNLRMICERYSEVSQEVYAWFIDYEKVFNRVDYEKIVKCLSDIGVNGKDLKLIVNLYRTQTAYIWLEKSLSDEIRIKTGVRQGCVMSACLFNLYTETTVRQ